MTSRVGFPVFTRQGGGGMGLSGIDAQTSSFSLALTFSRCIAATEPIGNTRARIIY